MRIYTSANRVGEKYGALLVIESVPVEKGNKKWLCLCDCGKKHIVSAAHLRNGNTTSCGCLKKEKIRQSSTKHGLSTDKETRSEYHVWVGIKRRCYDTKTSHYKNYGARGIYVHENWLGENGFPNFLKDMGKKPTDRHSLDRVDNNGPYSPANCKWSTAHEQQRNKRDNHVLEYNGEKMVLLDWANKLNVERHFIYHHLKTKPFNEVVELILSGNHRTRKRRTVKTKPS